MGNDTYAQKLKRVRTYERQEELMTEWRENWYADQKKTIDVLIRDIQKGNLSEAEHLAKALSGMTEKRFGTLRNMIKIINNRDYELTYSDILENEELGKIKDKYKF